jgi:hypothetical protein
MTTTFAKEVRDVSVRTRPALVKAAEVRASRRHSSGFGAAAGAGLAALARLVGYATVLAVCLAAVVAAGKGIYLWYKANTQNHTATVIVCSSYLAGGLGDPKTGAIDTSAGSFLLDPMKVDNRAYSSTAAIALFQRGQLVRVTWHGQAGTSAYITAFTVLKPSGNSCSGIQHGALPSFHSGQPSSLTSVVRPGPRALAA